MTTNIVCEGGGGEGSFTFMIPFLQILHSNNNGIPHFIWPPNWDPSHIPCWLIMRFPLRYLSYDWCYFVNIGIEYHKFIIFVHQGTHWSRSRKQSWSWPHPPHKHSYSLEMWVWLAAGPGSSHAHTVSPCPHSQVSSCISAQSPSWNLQQNYCLSDLSGGNWWPDIWPCS